MGENTGVIRTLYRLTEYPPDLSNPVYREYPLLKLGVAGAVQYYAGKLTPVVEEIMTANPGYSRWVLTAPPYHGLPAAANLLCWDIYKRLEYQGTAARNISVVNLKKAREDTVLENAKDFSNYNDYSKYTWEERLTLKRKHQFPGKEEDFCGRGIVFINDINVTGSGHAYISKAFAEIYPGKLNWLYIIDCDEAVGRTMPQLENEINNFTIKTLHDFGTVLARDDIRHTAKCISKLFTYSTGELEQLLAMMNPGQRSRLWDAVLEEGLYHGDFFKEKMELLRIRCTA
jgi:hypothetical protein